MLVVPVEIQSQLAGFQREVMLTFHLARCCKNCRKKKNKKKNKLISYPIVVKFHTIEGS